MHVIFLGVGEAFDENFINNSHVVYSTTKLLLDCGYSVPRQLWRLNNDKDFLDAVYLSHPHADHYLGLPVLLARMQDESRQKPLKVICHHDICDRIPHLMEYAHKNLNSKLVFPIEYIEISQASVVELNELTLRFAETAHSTTNLAIRIEIDHSVICYSGDGSPTAMSKALFQNADLLIHEAFSFDEDKFGHANIVEVLQMSEEAKVKTLALTHLNRRLRRRIAEVKEFLDKNPRRVNVIIPEPLDHFQF